VCENWDNTAIVVACQLSQKEKLTLSLAHTLTRTLWGAGKVVCICGRLTAAFLWPFPFSGFVSKSIYVGQGEIITRKIIQSMGN